MDNSGFGPCYDVARFGDLLDVQYDHMGTRLATASGDGVVRVWSAQTQQLLSELRGHRAAVWSLSWTHGRFATSLASVSSDGLIIIWREAAACEWRIVHQLDIRGPVPVIAFCSHEHGVVLAAACSSGEVQMLTRREVTASPVLPAGEQWQAKSFRAHAGGVVALSWAPSASPAILATGPAARKAATCAPRRLATCGADGLLIVWAHDDKSDSWSVQSKLSDEQYCGMPRDVAWRPNVGIPSSMVAFCTQEGCVAIWVQDMDGQPWRLQATWQVDGDARRLSWSKAGTLLGVSVGDANSLMYKEGPAGSWTQITSLDG
mmetsp:Transcript_101980/g.186843  ORF Transcript_101980/g.186843 Transcript_101980/m.186843 type:complete len:318 (-) Transcript_101980:72-1025(-)